MTKSFSHLPRVDPHAKSTSWRSTSLVWLIGEVGVAIWQFFPVRPQPLWYFADLQAHDFGEVGEEDRKKREKKWQAGGAIQLIKTKTTTTTIGFWSCPAAAARSLNIKKKWRSVWPITIGTHSLPSLILLFNCVKLSRQL